MADVNVSVDVENFISSLDRISDNLERDMLFALNSAAFELRKKWRMAISEDVDKPSPFTTNPGNVIVDKATFDDLSATIRVANKQAEYLSFMVEGLRRKGSDIAGVGGKILTPVGEKLTRFGGIPFGPPRYVGKVLRGDIKNAELFSPHNDGKRAVYKRLRGNHLKLLAVFVNMAEYKKELPLFDIAKEFSDDVVKQFDKVVERILK